MSERLKFRNVHIGVTSWVIQGRFAENMRERSKDVDDMEIVLFDTPQGSNIPKKDEVMELRGLCQELGMTCTVHFPEDVCFSTDAAERTRCEDQCLRTAELFAPLEPFAWILHLDGEHRGGFPSYDMDSWREKTAKSAERIAASVEDRTKICVENLDFDYDRSIGGLAPYFDAAKPKNWKDVNAYRIGISHQWSDTLKLMAGFAIDKTPVPSSTLGFELPDSDAKLYSVGFEYKVTQNLKMGLAYLYDDKEERSATNSAGVNGKFTDSAAHLLTASFKYKF